MIPALILYLAFHLIITKHISSLLAYKNKFKSDNYISIQMLTTNNKIFQTIITKNTISNNTLITFLDNNKLFNTATFTKCLNSCKSKRISENKDNNKLLSLVTSIKCLHSHASKSISKKNKDSDSKSKATTAFLIASTKYLAQNKTAYTMVESSSN